MFSLPLIIYLIYSKAMEIQNIFEKKMFMVSVSKFQPPTLFRYFYVDTSLQSNSKSIQMHEYFVSTSNESQDGQKLVCIISEAASAGVSLQV